MLVFNESTLASVFAPRTTIAQDGTVEGYASLFGEIDQARDMVMASAFRQTLMLRGVRRIPMLFQHDPAEPIGVWLDLVEDSRGLYARGKLIPDVQRAREVLALVEARAIDGLSIGFKTTKARVEPKTRVRKLFAVDLWEISIVTFPLLAGARVRAVKDARSATLPNESDRHERLYRRHPHFSFTRKRAEAEWKGIWRSASPDERASHAPPGSPSRASDASRLDRVDARRQAPPSWRERRIRGWIADSALGEMAVRKASFARPAR